MGRPHENKDWEQQELNKAYTFFLELKKWWENDNCVIMIFAESFPTIYDNPPAHEYHVLPPDKDQFQREIQNDKRKDGQEQQYDEYVVHSGDHSPSSEDPPKKMRIKRGVNYDPYLADELKTDLNNILTNVTKLTLIVSGKNAGYFTEGAHDPNWLSIASHWAGIPLGDGEDYDKFNIGLVMPNVPANDWDEAFTQEFQRLSELVPPQTPIRWP